MESRGVVARGLLLLVALVVLLSIGWVERYVRCYWEADARFEALCGAHLTSRVEIRRFLHGLREREITDPRRITTPLARDIKPGSHYVTYETCCGLTIDVLYDENGSVVGMWSAYN